MNINLDMGLLSSHSFNFLLFPFPDDVIFCLYCCDFDFTCGGGLRCLLDLCEVGTFVATTFILVVPITEMVVTYLGYVWDDI